jgi:hypothetical protein
MRYTVAGGALINVEPIRIAFMEAEGFEVNPEEWWHFDYTDWRLYPIMNVPFEELNTPVVH